MNMHQHNGQSAQRKRPFPTFLPFILLILLLFTTWGSLLSVASADEPPPPTPDVAAPPEEGAIQQPAVVDVPTMSEHMLYLPFITLPSTSQANTTCGLNDEETAVASLAMNHPNQGRAVMNCNPILAQVARERAADMAIRQYFSHTDPDGIGPNQKVRAAGYNLPSWYSGSNNIESIAAGYPTAQAAWDAWLNSSGHRVHVLAEASFWADQTNYGIGYYYDASSPYRHYWVFITAPPE